MKKQKTKNKINNNYFTKEETQLLMEYAKEDNITSLMELIISKIFKEQKVDDETAELIQWRLIEKFSDHFEKFTFKNASSKELKYYFNAIYEKTTDWTSSLVAEINQLKK